MELLNFVRVVPEVEKRLADDMSKKIYSMRIDWAVHRNLDDWTENLLNLGMNLKYPKLESLVNDGLENLIIFGAGECGRNLLRCLLQAKRDNLNIFFCDNDKSKHGTLIYGVKVISPQEALTLPNGIIAISMIIERFRDEVYQQLISIGYPESHIIKNARALCGIVENEYFDYFEPHDNEIFVDGGCLNGQTAVNFTQWASSRGGGVYDYVYSFEPDPTSIDRCIKTFKDKNLKGEVINKGLWNEDTTLTFMATGGGGARISDVGEAKINTTTLDEVLNGRRVTFIKLDIEGAEYNALLGAKETIKKWHPRLAICVYHKPEDIFEIPALLLDMQSDYQFALRQYRTDPLDTILYAY